MADYFELKKLAEDAVIFAGVNGEISYAQEQFIAAANPAAVLVLLDDLESAQKKIDQAWNRSTPALDGYIPGAMDAWKRPVKQHLPYDFSGNPGASATQYCNGWNDSGGYWKNHCLDLQAQIAGLKTGYEAYEQVNAGLKAEVEGLRKSAPSTEIIWCACGDGHAANSYGAGFMDANDGVCANCDAALGLGGQS